MNQLHFQRVWGGTAAHKELWRWHFGYPGTTVTCKSSQFYVCGENIKFYEVMVSNITKDISLLAWNSDIHPCKAFARGLPKLTLSSFVPQSCLIPGSSAFILSSWRCARVPAPAELWQHWQLFGGQIYLQYLRAECAGLYLSSGEEFFSWFRSASSWRLSWELLFHLSSDWFQVLPVIIAPLLPCLPGTVTSECLCLYFRHTELVFFGPEPAAPALLAGTASQGLTGRAWAGNQVHAPGIPLKCSAWGSPKHQHPAEAVAETLRAPSEMHPVVFGPIKEGPLWKGLSSAPRVAPAWSPLFWSECEAKLCSYFSE